MRVVSLILTVAGLLSVTGCIEPAPTNGQASSKPVIDGSQAETIASIDAAIARARVYLIRAQEGDGAWRSDTYPAFKDGPALTPTIALALRDASLGDGDADRAVARACRYVTWLVELQVAQNPDYREQFDPPLDFPTYTAAYAVHLLANRSDASSRAALESWLEVLDKRQLDSDLGWRPTDPQFGGFGYYPTVPRRPRNPAAVPYVGSNISATTVAVDALRAAGREANDQSIGNARRFAERCQNFHPFADTADDGGPLGFDGGFFFSPTDDAKNKAGPIAAGDANANERRYRSYGSATADGLRILLAAGLPPDHPRVEAARMWLVDRFDPLHNPGRFTLDREVLRDGYYFYYCQSVARVLGQLNVPPSAEKSNSGPEGSSQSWARQLAEELIDRQRGDGSWQNNFTDGREDDPLLATAFALQALARCRAEVR